MSSFRCLLAGVRGMRGCRVRYSWSIGVVVMALVLLKMSKGGVMAEDICPNSKSNEGSLVMDTTIFDSNSPLMPDPGSDPVMRVVNSTFRGESRGLLKFNSLQLPRNALLIRATLFLRATEKGGRVKGYRMLARWDEKDASWDITNGEPWETAASFALSGKKKKVSVDVTADVEAWHQGLAVNNGWILIASSNRVREFSTSESEKSPRLELEWCDVCPILKEEILLLDDPTDQCRDFQAAGCSAVELGIENLCPTSFFGTVMKFGDLNMVVTSAFQWRWDDRGSGGRDNGAFYHPYCPMGFFPLGSVAASHYDDIDGDVVAMCFQDADNRGLLDLPVGWKRVWNDRRSGALANGSSWRAECPLGYVTLGNVFVTGYSEPDIFDVACVRQDLTDFGSFTDVAVWTDSRRKFSVWQVLSNGRAIAVNSFVGLKTRDRPDDSLSINMRLPDAKKKKTKKVCPGLKKKMCDPCLIVKEEIKLIKDRRDKCRAFDEGGCSKTMDVSVGSETVCPPPFPEVSTEVEDTREVCDIKLSDPNDIPFDTIISLAWGIDGRFYGVGEVGGKVKLIIMDIVVRLFEEDDTARAAQCSLDIVQECSFPLLDIEAVALSNKPEGGTAQIYVAGHDKADGSPFISLVAVPSDGSTACELVENSIDFVLPPDREDSNAIPFFDGLTTAPIGRDILWSATQTSLYRPNETKTSLGDFQYYFTPFDLESGKAVPYGEFLYFAETSMPEEDSDSFVLRDNKLVDVVALDDYGSFLTMESGFVHDEGAPTMAPTDESFEDDFGPLSFDPVVFPPGSVVPVPPKIEYVATVGPRTCFYRAYVEILFAKVGVARKDLIECVEEEYTAVAIGEAEVSALETPRSLRNLLRRDGDHHRELRATRRSDFCTSGDNVLNLAILKKREETGELDARELKIKRIHLNACETCTLELHDDVENVIMVQKLEENVYAIDIETFVAEAVNNTSSFEENRRRSNSKACGLVIDNMVDMDSTLVGCSKNVSCGINDTEVNAWQTRGTTINFCCASYVQRKGKK